MNGAQPRVYHIPELAELRSPSLQMAGCARFEMGRSGSYTIRTAVIEIPYVDSPDEKTLVEFAPDPAAERVGARPRAPAKVR